MKQIVFPKSFRDNIDRAYFVSPHCGNWAAATLDKRTLIGPYNYNDLDKVQPLELNHYATKTYEEAKQKCDRGRADCAQKRDLDAFFREHDLNEVENMVARDFFFGAI